MCIMILATNLAIIMSSVSLGVINLSKFYLSYWNTQKIISN